MPIENIYIMPHGSMVLDPKKEDEAYQNDIYPLYEAIKHASDHLSSR